MGLDSSVRWNDMLKLVMQITFKLFGFTDMLPDNEASIVVPEGASLKDALSALAGQLGEDFKRRLLKESGQLHDHIRLVVEGRVVDRLDEKVPGDTTVFILHEIAGG